MSEKVRSYASDEIEVTYSVTRCIHAAKCVHGLPRVFDPSKRRWIAPESGRAWEIAEVVARCPTGALHFLRKDGGPAETPDEPSVTLEVNGPLHVRGDIVLSDGDDSVIVEDLRMALCRCGASKNKPFCDGSHAAAGFVHDGTLGDGGVRDPEAPDERLRVRASRGGPLLVTGDFEVRSADGGQKRRGTVAAFCRCGHSSNKPFCDGTHRKVGISE